MLDSLPGRTSDKINKLESGVDTLVDEFDKQIKPLKKAAASTVGAAASLLPDFIAEPLNKVKDWLKGDEDTIQGEVQGLLAKSAIEEQIQSKLSNLTENKELDVLKLIAEATNKTSIYTSEYNSNYYKRSLELELKQTLTLTKIFTLLKEDSEKRDAQLEAIVKNTSLPDAAKTSLSHMFKESLLKTGLNSATGAMFKKNDVITNLTKGLKGKMTDGMTKAADALNMGGDTAQMLKDAEEQGISPVAMLTSMLTGSAVTKVTDKTVKYLLDKAQEDETLGGKLGDIDKLMSDPKKALEEVQHLN